MIKVTKDLISIPDTLTRGSTVSKRNGVIAMTLYPRVNSTSIEKQKKKVKGYDSRFKQSDIKTSLKMIYNDKCAYCEQQVVAGSDISDNKSTIEHYRPKSIYYWLAYSWDNLLWCCHRCNQNKSNQFAIIGTEINYHINFLTSIHDSCNTYNGVEQPKMIHPEVESVISQLIFNANGKIDSDDMRVKYTITTCGIDRDDLNEKRKKILDELIKKINARKLENSPYMDIITQFKIDMSNKYNEFIAFRYWILRNIQTLV